MKPPLQERSEASLERILDAAERLVRRQGFQKTSLTQICREAGLTTGAFYARFARKEDLAFPLWQRFEPRSGEAVERFAEALAEAPLGEALRVLLQAVIDTYQRDGALLRELVLLAPKNPELAAAMRITNDRHLERLVALVRGSGARITHPRPEVAVGLGLVSILNTLRELVLDQVLFEEYSPIPTETLADELARMLLAYLGV